MNPAEAGPKAKEAAQRALAIDPTVADAHYALALVSLNERDWPTAESEFQQAIKLKPGYALAYDWYAWILAMMGRFDESFVQFKRGLEVDPLSLPINADLGQSYYWARRYDQSVEQLRKTLELDPSFTPTIHNLAMTYAAQGQYQQAVAELNKVKDLEHDPFNFGTLGYVYAKWGKKREARQTGRIERTIAEQLHTAGGLLADSYRLGRERSGFRVVAEGLSYSGVRGR